MNLDVDAPDKVAGVLTAAATAYQASAVELSPPGRIATPQ
jgi:hypothetical protein